MNEKASKGRLFKRIFEAVRLIPEGAVATYGQVTRYVGGCSPKMVGFAMAAAPFDSDIPWHRVINHKGMISVRADGDGDEIQRRLLEAEGVHFDEKGRIDLGKVRWEFPI